MTTILKWDGMGLADELAMTTSRIGTGDTAPTAITGTAGIVDLDVLYKGAPSIRCTPAASTAARHVWLVGDRAVATYGWAYTTPAAWTSAAYNIFGIQTNNNGTLQCRVNLAGTGAPGELRLANNAGTSIVVSPTGTMAVSTAYWFELQVSQNATVANTTCRLRVWRIDTGVLVWDSGVRTGAAIGSTHNRIAIGSYDTTPVPGVFRFGRVLADDGNVTWGTPVDLSAPGTAFPTVTVMVAGVRRAATVKGVMVGGVLQAASVKLVK